MLILALAAALTFDAGQVAVIARTPAPAEARATETPASAQGARRVCRLERATGSNMQQRVCRTRPAAGARDQQTREFMEELQRARLPDELDHAAGGPQPR